MRQRYSVVQPSHDWPKYLELEKWMQINLRRVQDLGLDYGLRKRILDIGSGTGYFLHICRFLGHDVVGLDIDILPISSSGKIPSFVSPRAMWMLAMARVGPLYSDRPRLARRHDRVAAARAIS